MSTDLKEDQPGPQTKRWSTEETLALIAYYKSLPALWDTKCAEYRDRNLKNIAIRHLSTKIGATLPEIIRKWHNLRSQLGGEYKKMAKNPSYISRWEYLAHLQFLNSGAVCAADDTTDIILEEETIFAEPISKVERDCEESNITLSQFDSEINLRIPETDPICSTAHGAVNDTEDEYMIFAKFIASEMRNLRTDVCKRRLKRGIQRLLLEISEQDDEIASRRPNLGI